MLLVLNKGATALKKEIERMPSTQELGDSVVEGLQKACVGPRSLSQCNNVRR
jgi:hypothetical protein